MAGRDLGQVRVTGLLMVSQMAFGVTRLIRTSPLASRIGSEATLPWLDHLRVVLCDDLDETESSGKTKTNRGRPREPTKGANFSDANEPILASSSFKRIVQSVRAWSPERFEPKTSSVALLEPKL